MQCPHPGLRAVFGADCPGCAEERAAENAARRAREAAPEPEVPISLERARRMLDLLDAEAERRSFREFVLGNWAALEPNGRPFVANAGSDAIIEHLQALGDGVIKRLGIAVSPGTGKSTLSSVAYPAWMWARRPAWRVICASHAFELAQTLAGKFHRLVTGDRFARVHGDRVKIVGEALKAINTSRSGYRYAIGVEGALTGLRADGGIIDDSLNAIDANSRHALRAVNEWYDNAFSTRFDHGDSAPICVIQQRLGEHDLIQHVRERGFEILELAARYDSTRPCKTSIWIDPRKRDGEILCPEIQSQTYLDEQLKTLGERGFAMQYDQRPAPREGNQFKVGGWNYHVMPGKSAGAHPRPDKARQTPPRELAYHQARDGMRTLAVDWACLSIDASGGSTSEDASALGISGIVGVGEWRHVLRDYTDGPKSWKQTIDVARRSLVDFAAMVGRQRRLEVLVEKKALGQGALFEELTDAIGAGDLQYPDGTPIKAAVIYYDPTGRGDKWARACALEPDIDAGLITVEDGAKWVAPYVDEFGMFTESGSSRDDRIDVLAQCCDHYRVKGKSTLEIKFPTMRVVR